MKSRLFYSLPPAGNKIDFSTIVRSLKRKFILSEVEPGEVIRHYFGTRRILYASSGRAALWIILKALASIKREKNEIILPAYTCPAVASSVLKAGLKPILCDINLNDFGFEPENLELKTNKHTLAVIVVHLFGYPANLEAVKECCDAKDVFVVEDAAQALGNSMVRSPDKKLGFLGDAGFFSFGRGKPISIGHGAILVAGRDEIFIEAEKILKNLTPHNGYGDLKYLFKLGSYSLFSNPFFYWIPQNIPFFHLGETIFEEDFGISEGAGILTPIILELLRSMGREKEIRQKNTQGYYEGLNGIPYVQNPPESAFPYLRYPFIVKDNGNRDRILERLMLHGTGSALFYPTPLNELPGLREILKDDEIYPNGKRLSESLMTLPVHSGVTASNQEKIIGIIKNSMVQA